MTSFMQVLKGVIWTFVGVILGYVTVYKMGDIILNMFVGQNTGFTIIFRIIQFIMMAVIVFIVPLIFIRNPEVMDNILKKFDGGRR